MNRRTYLFRVGGAVVGATVSSGCTDESLSEARRKPRPVSDFGVEDMDLPVAQRLAIAEETILLAEDVAIGDLDGLEMYLDGHGVPTEQLEDAEEAGDPIVSLEYVVEETSERGLMHHLGIVAGGYARLISRSHESEKLSAGLLDSTSKQFGVYEIRRRWAEEWTGGELTAREYAHEIALTAEST